MVCLDQSASVGHKARRGRPAGPRELGRVELWLMEHGIWVPLGAALMALCGAVGVAAYAARLTTLVQFSAFVFLIGLGCFLYGRYDVRRMAGVKDENEDDQPAGEPGA